MVMTPEAWTAIGTGVVVLIAIATSHRHLRDEFRREMRAFRDEIRAEMKAGHDELRGEMKAGRDESRAEMKAGRDESRAEMKAGHDELRGEVRAGREEFRAETNQIHADVGGLRERMARLEGLLEGLREPITGRKAA